MSQCFYSSDSQAYEHGVLKWKLVTYTRGYQATFQIEKLKKNPQTKQKYIPLLPPMSELFLDLKLQGMQQHSFPKFQDTILMMANGDLRTQKGRYKNQEEKYI